MSKLPQGKHKASELRETYYVYDRKGREYKLNDILRGTARCIEATAEAIFNVKDDLNKNTDILILDCSSLMYNKFESDVSYMGDNVYFTEE